MDLSSSNESAYRVVIMYEPYMSRSMRRISYKNIDTLILFGGSFLMARLLNELLLRKFGHRIVLFTAPRHLNGVIDGQGTTLRTFLKNRNISFFEAEDINNYPKLHTHVTKNTMGLALGAAWPFEKKTAELFEAGHLLDVMGVDLPRYRGGAHYTWQILHTNRQGAVNLQVVLGGADTFHKGPIIKSVRYLISRDVSEPLDYFNFCIEKEIKFLVSFFDDVWKRKVFALRRLDERYSSWYPFLSTVHHGFINWSWKGKDIASFINAFGNPYKGASTYIGGRRVFLKGCVVRKAEETYHPFTAGIVIRRNAEGIFVATKGALLRITEIIGEDGKDMCTEILPGSRCYTPFSKLDRAMSFDAEYNASGLRKKKI